MSDMNLNDLPQNLIDNPSPQNSIFSEIVKTLFGDIQQYETDVPENFKRPCFLFINPDKNTRTQELTKRVYKIIQHYEIYFFALENDIEKLTSYKIRFIDYLMGIKKIPIFDTERKYFTIEQVTADTDDVNSMAIFSIEVSRIQNRDLRKPSVPKIKHIVNNIIIDRGNKKEDER